MLEVRVLPGKTTIQIRGIILVFFAGFFLIALRS